MLCLFISHIALAQQKAVSGIVKDATDNSLLPKVTVKVKGTSKGVTTNEAGYYSIDVSKGETLVFTFVGYVTKEVKIGDGNIINIDLTSNENQLGEVVVTAYDIKRNKREMTYQTNTVSGSEIASTKRENFITHELQG